MTRYLVRWQMLFLRRQLLTFQGLFPLVASLVFQVALIAVMVAKDSHSAATGITMVVLYVTVFGLMQVSHSFIRTLSVAQSGLLGMAPVPPRSKMVMALLGMAVIAGLNALTLSIGITLTLSLRYRPVWAILTGALLFSAAFFIYLGVGTGFVSVVVSRLPEKMRPSAAGLMGLLMVIVGIGYPFLMQHAPRLSRIPGTLLIHLAQGRPDPSLFVMAGVIASGMGLTLLPLKREFSDAAARLGDGVAAVGENHQWQNPGGGLARLFWWRDRAIMRKTRWLLPVLLLLVVGVPVVLGRAPIYWFGLVGLQLGTSIFSVVPIQSMSLRFMAPIAPDRYWRSRLLSLVPTGTALVLLLFGAEWMAGDIHRPLLLFNALVLTYASIVVSSFAMVYFRFGTVPATMPKRLVVTLTLSVLGIFVVVSGLGLVGQAWPRLGLAVNALVSLGGWWGGGYLIRKKRSLYYQY